MAIIENLIKSVQIVNNFNNGPVYEVGKSVFQDIEGKQVKCKIVEILDQGSSCYYEILIIVKDSKGKGYIHKKLRNIPVSIDFF